MSKKYQEACFKSIVKSAEKLSRKSGTGAQAHNLSAWEGLPQAEDQTGWATQRGLVLKTKPTIFSVYRSTVQHFILGMSMNS